MKQKTRFKNFGNIGIGYWSMNGRYVGIGPNKAISVDLYLRTYYLKSFFFHLANSASAKAWARWCILFFRSRRLICCI